MTPSLAGIELLRRHNLNDIKSCSKSCKDSLNDRHDIYDKISDMNKRHPNATGKTQVAIAEQSQRWQAKEREYRHHELLFEQEMDVYEGALNFYFLACYYYMIFKTKWQLQANKIFT